LSTIRLNRHDAERVPSQSRHSADWSSKTPSSSGLHLGTEAHVSGHGQDSRHRHGVLDGDDELAITCLLHDLTIGVGDVRLSMHLATPYVQRPEVRTLRTSGSTAVPRALFAIYQGLWMSIPPPTSVIAVHVTVEER
jgi:hypothetical protein